MVLLYNTTAPYTAVTTLHTTLHFSTLYNMKCCLVYSVQYCVACRLARVLGLGLIVCVGQSVEKLQRLSGKSSAGRESEAEGFSEQFVRLWVPRGAGTDAPKGVVLKSSRKPQ